MMSREGKRNNSSKSPVLPEGVVQSCNYPCTKCTFKIPSFQSSSVHKKTLVNCNDILYRINVY